MAKKRPKSWDHKQLPLWIIEPAERAGWIKITCPRKDCKQVSFVKRGPWLHGSKRNYIGRSCTYCFAVSRIPVGDE